MKKTLMIAAGLALAGCSSTGPIGMGDCASIDWFRYGYRDGAAFSGLSDLERYTAYCQPAGVTPDAAQYSAGFAQGRIHKALRSP
jgi:hypothetical protein